MTENNGFNQVVSRELILRAQRDELDAFEQIYRLLSKPSYALAFRICRQHTVAEDIVHDAFIKIMRNISQFRHEGSFSGWCRRIVASESINRVKSYSHLQIESDELLEVTEDFGLFTQNWLNARLDIDELMKSLTPTSRAVFLLHEIEGYKHKEIAQMFGKSTSFSKVTLTRAYTTLKSLVVMEEKENKYAP